MTQPTQSHLLPFIISLLTPLLTAGGITDLNLARLAAQETIDAYRAGGQQELLTISQVVAFALTALDNLRLSMPAELSLSMKLKLRGNANALNRAARDATQLLQKSHHQPEAPESSLAEQAAIARASEPQPEDPAEPVEPVEPTQAEPIRTEIPQAAPPANCTTPRDRLHWADAMQAEAAKLKAQAAITSATQRKSNLLWIDVLSDVAGRLRQGNDPIAAPAQSKASLLRTTILASDPEFAAHLASLNRRRV